jgi:radical SAM superfamily enzyme YgiQ (UPF0313 family)
MKALFVDFSNGFYDRNSIYYLIPILKKAGVEPHYVQSRDFSKIVKYIEVNEIDILLYSSFSNMIEKYSNFDNKIKKVFPKIFSLLGGPGVTQLDERKHLVAIGTTINAICVGEGETALYNFFSNGMVFEKNIIRPNDLREKIEYYDYVNLSELDFPDRDLVYKHDTLLRDMPTKQFMAGRGCPFKCSYCHNHTINTLFKGCGPTLRLKDVDYLIEEVLDVKNKYPLKMVVFQDDIFFYNKKWSLEFAKKWKEKVNLPWSCNLRPDYMNKELVMALAESGCTTISWSIESGNEDIRARLLARKMGQARIERFASHLNESGIKHRTGNIIGIPGETIANMHETIITNIKAKPYLANAHIFAPYKGLELTNYALDNGHLSQESFDDIPDTFFEKTALNFSSSDKSKIQRIMLLFPLFVSFPFLYYFKFFNIILFLLPVKLLIPMNKFFVGFRTSQLFAIKGGLRIKLRLMVRFLKFGT